MISSNRLELLSIVLLGLGQMCIMTGYDTQSFIAESVLHSVNSREPSRIDAYAGYYGQATCYASYMIACLFAPSVLSILSPKWTLFIGSICYTLYQIGFFYLNNYYYYISCSVMGIGFALYYTGHGAYLTSHSTRATIEQNSAIAWSIACLCMIAGAAILAGIFSWNRNISDFILHNSTLNYEIQAYRQFSDVEIRMMFGAFTIFTLCANLIFAIAPSKDIPDCIEGKRNKIRLTFKEELNQVLAIFVDRRMIPLTPLFLHLGFYTSFWVCVYPTTLIFTKSLSGQIYLPAYYSLSVGIGEVVMGVIISSMSKRIKDFGLKPTMFSAFGITTVILTIVVASVPEWSATGPTDAPGWLLDPSVILSISAAFLIGAGDSCVNNVRNVISVLALPDRRAQVFAISKFYQAFAGAILMFLSPYLSIFHYSTLLFCSLFISTCCFVYAAGKTKRMEQQESTRDYVDEKNDSIERY